MYRHVYRNINHLGIRDYRTRGKWRRGRDSNTGL